MRKLFVAIQPSRVTPNKQLRDEVTVFDDFHRLLHFLHWPPQISLQLGTIYIERQQFLFYTQLFREFSMKF